MAAKRTKKGKNNSDKRQPPWLRIILILVALGLVGVALPSIMLLFFGMLPTWVAFLVDRGMHRYLTFSVGGLNFCGVFPYLMDLWSGSNTFALSVSLLTDIFAMAIMLGAAALGWVLYSIIPPFIASFLKLASEQRVASLRGTQKELIQEWGSEVTGHEEPETDDAPPPPPS